MSDHSTARAAAIAAYNSATPGQKMASANKAYADLMKPALHVFSVADEEWVIAANIDDAMAVMRETGADPGERDYYEQCDDAKPFTFTDGDAITKPFGEWAAERGRGYFGAANG